MDFPCLQKFLKKYSNIKLFFFYSSVTGRPLPKVTWWRDGVEIFGKSQHSIDEGVAAVVSPLFIGTVTREFFGSKLECRAQGSKLIPAVTKTVTLQVHCEYRGNYVWGLGCHESKMQIILVLFPFSVLLLQ